MYFTGVELLRRVDKRGEEKRTGKPITKTFYGSVLLSRAELLSVSATVNRRADQIIAIEQISTDSGEGWKYSNFSATVKVLLQEFKLTVVTKERLIKIGIALDAAPLMKKLSLFTVSIIVCDPDGIDPKTGKKISKLSARYVHYCIHIKRFTNNSRSFQSRQSHPLHPRR
jgi:hypothetical protein